MSMLHNAYCRSTALLSGKAISLIYGHFIDAARRFFQTTTEVSALKDKGKYGMKVTQQRRRNRITRVSLGLSIYQHMHREGYSALSVCLHYVLVKWPI